MAPLLARDLRSKNPHRYRNACLHADQRAAALLPGPNAGVIVSHQRSLQVGALARRIEAASQCPVRQAGRRAAAENLRASGPLCARHVLALRRPDPPMAERAGGLSAELAEAFSARAWDGDTWLRAVAFVDGSVFAGCGPIAGRRGRRG